MAFDKAQLNSFTRQARATYIKQYEQEHKEELARLWQALVDDLPLDFQAYLGKTSSGKLDYAGSEYNLDAMAFTQYLQMQGYEVDWAKRSGEDSVCGFYINWR